MKCFFMTPDIIYIYIYIYIYICRSTETHVLRCRPQYSSQVLTLTKKEVKTVIGDILVVIRASECVNVSLIRVWGRMNIPVLVS